MNLLSRLLKAPQAPRPTARYRSQAGQDFWVINEIFNRKEGGFFLEIGAADGVTFNNTYILEKDFGWKGLCIEANPVAFETLTRERSVPCLNICLDATEGEVEFRVDGLFSTIVAEDTDAALDNGRDTARTVVLKSRPLLDVLEEQKCPAVIDYLSIDTEGSELRILSNFPFAQYTFRSLTVERPNDALQELLTGNGYVRVKEIPNLDSFYVHTSWLKSYRKNALKYYQSLSEPEDA